jgi:hypothetical protein
VQKPTLKFLNLTPQAAFYNGHLRSFSDDVARARNSFSLASNQSPIILKTLKGFWARLGWFKTR